MVSGTDEVARFNSTEQLGNGLTRGPSEDWKMTERPRKVLKPTLSEVASATSLESMFKTALPDKEQFFPEWIKALADPKICITSLEDVNRLGLDDIPSLPVPPLVKGIFRDIIKVNIARGKEQEAVLEATGKRAREFLAPLRDRNMHPPSAGSKYFQEQKNFRLILTNEEVQAGVGVVAHRIETWCKGERIVLVGILKGAFMFMSDLCRAMTRPYSVYFVEASSYKEGRTQAASVEVSSDICKSKFVDPVTKDKHKIVLIDELLDNGKTMEDMKRHILDVLKDSHTEADILTVCLFSKDRARECPEADVTGIPNLPDLWLVGYGLDDRGTKRGWTDLFAVPKVKIVGTIEQEEAKKLMDKVDDDLNLTSSHVFSGFELAARKDTRYRVSGLDTQGAHDRSKLRLQATDTQVKSKADVQASLNALHVVKGKYEHEINFAFIANNVKLVPEDEIFFGNNQVYARMRCRLRKSIEQSARRCGIQINI